MPRPSNYRKSYGVDKKDYVVVSPEAQKMKEEEKNKMKKLNNRLVNYVDKVHDLEMANRLLAAENERLKKQKKEPENDVSEIYEDELKRLREKVEVLQGQNTKLEIETDNLQYDMEETVAKLETEKELNKDLESEITGLRKDVDDATIERSNLETKIENLQEAIQLERKVHEAEMENLRAQVTPAQAPVLNAEQPSMLPDLNDAIVQVRKQYEAFNAKNLEDLDTYYKEKIESLSRQLKSAQEEVRELRVDNAEKRKRIHQLELELDSLRGKNDSLERAMDQMNDRMTKDAAAQQEMIKEMQKELDVTKEDLGKYLIDYQKLNTANMSLNQEIIIYQKVLSGEEARISEIDTSITTKKTRSRSSSRSSSSSSSRSSSEERTKDEIIEEMLEEKAESAAPKKESSTGVISVSWKVKGGTVRPAKPFEPSKDAEDLRKAMKGLGTDEDAIIAILSKRTKVQRAVIAKVFEEKYKENLLEELEGELNGNMKATVQHLMWKKTELDAHAIRKAIKGFGTDESVLIEIICTQSSKDLREIKTDYKRLFERDMDTDIEKETSGAFKKFLVAILKCNRPPDSGTVVSNLAEDDAKALFSIGVKNWGPSNATFLEIFSQRSFQHLWYLFKQCWTKLTKDDLVTTIEDECKGDLMKGLRTLVRFSTCVPPVYYAGQLYDAMTGKGTEDKQLIYIITTRSEIDLIDIKEEYLRIFKIDLKTHVDKEVSGNYQKLLLGIIN